MPARRWSGWRADGWLGTDAADDASLAAAVTAFLCATPAQLVGLSLDDLAGEREPVNLPGVPPERHESWTRRMRAPIEEFWEGEVARGCLDAVPEERRSS